MSAKVAAELGANQFWARSGFTLVRQEHPETGRTINWYFQDIGASALFTTTPASGAVATLSFTPARPRLENAVFVLDLNVVFDIVQDRIESDAAGRIFAGSFANCYQLAVTREFVEELERHKKAGDDPILSFATQLPTLPALPGPLLGSICHELVALGLPDPNGAAGTRQNIRSDLRHLASCIHHKATGFVTRDLDLLKKAEIVRERFDIEMVSPTDLDMEAPPALHPHSASMDQDSQSLSIRIRPMREDERDSVAMFLSQLGIDEGWADTALRAGSSADLRVRVVAELEGVVFGFSSWQMIGESDLEIHLFVDEQAPQSTRVVDHILEVTQRRGSSHALGRSVVYCPLVQLETRSTAMRNGFQIQADATYSNSVTLARTQFPAPVLETTWQRLREECDKKLGWKLTARFPTYEEATNTGVPLRENDTATPVPLSLVEFENRVAPAILLLSRRPATIVPIQPAFARSLCPCEPAATGIVAAVGSEPVLRTCVFLSGRPSHESAGRRHRGLL